MNVATQRRLTRRALEHERLIGKIERVAVQQIDFHLRRAIFMDQRVDGDVLVFAELVDVIEQRVELVDRRDAVRLAAGFSAPRAADRRLQGVVGIDVRFDEVELELGGHHRVPAPLRIQIEHVLEHFPRRHPDAPAIAVKAIVDDLCRRLGGPRNAPHRARVGLQNNVDLGRTHRRRGFLGVIPGDGLQEDALRQAHALIALELLRRHDLAARDAGHVGDDGLDFLDVVLFEKRRNRIAHDINLGSARPCGPRGRGLRHQTR
jgi:hypothetical protein